ncbi:unnamed protein product [Adineta ricciae]|uniref:Uncharacterized protein n=1 Tax=Adineta ricciae TaxID=249248 RepID=A0A814YV05_ADIRI|nr:unnamed protein product [Adineta ricciae]CAF1311731.1 unnamed protein product [Adineta ricciae]
MPSNDNSRGINSTQRKRVRIVPQVSQEKVVNGQMNVNRSVDVHGQKKSTKALSEITNHGRIAEDIDIDTNSSISSSTPTGFNISLTSSLTQQSASPLSLSKVNERNDTTAVTSLHPKEKHTLAANTNLQSSIMSENSSQKNTSILSKRTSLTQPNSSTNANRTSTSSFRKNISSSQCQDSQANARQNNLSQYSTGKNVSRVDGLSSLSSSNSSDRSSSVNSTRCSTQSLVEGSLEYRELKRLYVDQKNLAEEWRKDYGVLKQQVDFLKSNTIPRPNADVLDWLTELMDLMKNNGRFKGDGRTLEKIGEDLGLDKTSLITVAARTPQKSALKIFRLLYPTIGSRADCMSISAIPKEQLENIYLYVRHLHNNLNFNGADMRKAIGTSIRSARCELRRLQYFQQQQVNATENEQSEEDCENLDDLDETQNDTDSIIDENEVLAYINDHGEDNEDVDDEDDDDNANHLMIHEADDDDD